MIVLTSDSLGSRQSASHDTDFQYVMDLVQCQKSSCDLSLVVCKDKEVLKLRTFSLQYVHEHRLVTDYRDRDTKRMLAYHH